MNSPSLLPFSDASITDNATTVHGSLANKSFSATSYIQVKADLESWPITSFHTHTNIHIYIHTYIHICKHIYIHIYIYTLAPVYNTVPRQSQQPLQHRMHLLKSNDEWEISLSQICWVIKRNPYHLRSTTYTCAFSSQSTWMRCRFCYSSRGLGKAVPKVKLYSLYIYIYIYPHFHANPNMFLTIML